MLEIVALWFLCTKMGEKLRKKGWKRPWPMQLLVVITWFGCMFLGSLAYAVVRVLKDGERAAEDLGFVVYPIAFLSAAAGVGLLFAITSILPSSLPPQLPQKEPTGVGHL